MRESRPSSAGLSRSRSFNKSSTNERPTSYHDSGNVAASTDDIASADNFLNENLEPIIGRNRVIYSSLRDKRRQSSEFESGNIKQRASVFSHRTFVKPTLVDHPQTNGVNRTESPYYASSSAGFRSNGQENQTENTQRRENTEELADEFSFRRKGQFSSLRERPKSCIFVEEMKDLPSVMQNGRVGRQRSSILNSKIFEHPSNEDDGEISEQSQSSLDPELSDAGIHSLRRTGSLREPSGKTYMDILRCEEDAAEKEGGAFRHESSQENGRLHSRNTDYRPRTSLRKDTHNTGSNVKTKNFWNSTPSGDVIDERRHIEENMIDKLLEKNTQNRHLNGYGNGITRHQSPTRGKRPSSAVDVSCDIRDKKGKNVRREQVSELPEIVNNLSTILQEQEQAQHEQRQQPEDDDDQEAEQFGNNHQQDNHQVIEQTLPQPHQEQVTYSMDYEINRKDAEIRSPYNISSDKQTNDLDLDNKNDEVRETLSPTRAVDITDIELQPTNINHCVLNDIVYTQQLPQDGVADDSSQFLNRPTEVLSSSFNNATTADQKNTTPPMTETFCGELNEVKGDIKVAEYDEIIDDLFEVCFLDSKRAFDSANVTSDEDATLLTDDNDKILQEFAKPTTEGNVDCETTATKLDINYAFDRPSSPWVELETTATESDSIHFIDSEGESVDCEYVDEPSKPVDSGNGEEEAQQIAASPTPLSPSRLSPRLKTRRSKRRSRSSSTMSVVGGDDDFPNEGTAVLQQISRDDYVMPTAVAMFSGGRTLVADYGVGSLIYYNPDGSFCHKIGNFLILSIKDFNVFNLSPINIVLLWCTDIKTFVKKIELI